jgi:hypothetical protein
MPSVEDALAFLTKLSAGKEEQLRAQAEEEAAARMADIMGGEKKRSEPKPAPQPEPQKPVTLGKAEVEAAARIAEIMKKPAEPVAAPQPPVREPSIEPGEEVSAEDALAFLQSFAEGKEEELRERAEREGDARLVAIMGGPPGTSPLRPPSSDEVPPELASMFEEELELEPEPEPEPEQTVEAKAEASVSARPARFWLITADDEDAVSVAPDYFERTAQPMQPAAPVAIPKAERVARKPAVPVVEPEPEPQPIIPAAGADELYERLENDPADYEARLGLARVLWAAGAREESLEMYLALLEEDALQYEVIDDLRRNSETHAHPDWYRALGDAYMKAGDLPNALEAYRKALTQL